MSELRALVLAGGVGQRLWPLSRKNSPKQFAALVGTKSPFQLAVERIKTLIPPERIYIGTNREYEDVLSVQATDVPKRNFILEPSRRDVAAAVALAIFSLEKEGASGPLLLQWSDNYVRNEAALLRAIDVGRNLVEENFDRMVFIGEKPRFANENLGWIELGEKLGEALETPYYSYRSWHYRPPKDECVRMFESGNFAWNAGFFVTSIEFLANAFRTLTPELAGQIEKIVAHRGLATEQNILNEIYPRLPSVHFDQAILEKLPTGSAVMLKTDLGWSDPGNLYSLKEALQRAQDETIGQGNVVHHKTTDSFICNQSGGKLVATMGLDGCIVVDTPDVLLVINKDSVRHMGELLKELSDRGYEHLL
jgi:mannose-1-phosphate guanylyltransferase